MLTLDEILKKLEDRNRMEVARRVGIPYSTLSAIASKRATDPHYSTLKKLSDYLEGKTDGKEGQ